MSLNEMNFKNFCLKNLNWVKCLTSLMGIPFIYEGEDSSNSTTFKLKFGNKMETLMKFKIIIFSFFLLAIPFGYTRETIGQTAFQIFNALNVDQTYIPATGFNTGTYQKVIRGMICMHDVGCFMDNYHCNLEILSDDHQEIYNALDVKPELVDPGPSRNHFVREIYLKRAGDFSCQKITLLSNEENPEVLSFYKCQLK
jgi:hypothetical protein